MTLLTTFLSVILPTLTAIVGWFVGRRKRNNDFISELQNSIDLLTYKYTKSLNELIEVKQQNAALLIGQNKLQLQVDNLTTENSALKKEVEELTTKLQDVKIITRQAK